MKKGKNHPNYKHGHTVDGHSKEYRAWCSMINRCERTTEERYPLYGGRGIAVCNRWRNSFEKFLEDVGPAPSAKHSIDRIDNDGNYEPENVRWATNSEQVKNSSRARIITFNGISKNICDWARELGVNRQTLQMRIDHYGWSIEKAMTTPALKGRWANNGRGELVEFQGKELTLPEWAKEVGINYRTIHKRIYQHNWSIKKALTTPVRKKTT